MKHVLNSNKSKIRLTKSPKTFVLLVIGISFITLFLFTALVWISVDLLMLKLLSLFVSLSLEILLVNRLMKLSEAFFMTDMIIVEPIVGKKIITPVQGVVVKKSIFSALINICKVHVRLDGKKSVHFLYGKCDDLLREKVKVEDFLQDLKKNKKVNHKPGSVSSVA